MILFIKRVLRDIRGNIFLNLVTLITIAFAVLIVGAFTLFFVNIGDLVHYWVADIRIMAYLEGDKQPDRIDALKTAIQKMARVNQVRFIPKEIALKRFKHELGRQRSLVEGLDQNPLPDALEVRIQDPARNWQGIEPLARTIEKMDGVAEVEYGQDWLRRVIRVFNLFKLSGYALGGLFFLAAIFFVANTIRLALYSRKDEIEIMRLVGASEGFIKDPFYVQALFQGAGGGLLGLTVLFVIFHYISVNMEGYFTPGAFEIRFLGPRMLLAILGASTLVGWLGCFISLRQFLKKG